MKFLRMLKATALIASIFKDENKVQELINIYRIETNKDVDIHELMNKTEEEIQSNPRAKDFTEWVTEKIFAAL